LSSESVNEFLEYVQRIGMHITHIYQQMQRLELRIETIFDEMRQIQYQDCLQREEFTALAQGLLCPALYARWKNIPKFLEAVTLLRSNSPGVDVIQEISPRTNPEALTLLNSAVTLDCEWAKRIILKSRALAS
jgi:hypothetical protein